MADTICGPPSTFKITPIHCDIWISKPCYYVCTDIVTRYESY